MAKADRIVIRLESEVRARLHAKASQLGLDDAAYVRMLIYRDLNELRPAAPAFELPAFEQRVPRSAQEASSDPDFDSQGRWMGTGPDPRSPGEEPEPLPVEEMDIPADADGGDPGALEELLAAGPSILDEMLELSQPAPVSANQLPANTRPRVPQRSYRAPLSRRRGLQPVYGPGSMTRAVGVNDMAIGANDFGDGVGNVLRDNMRHFGIVGTRSR